MPRNKSTKKKGFVSLVGAGPGDPKLLVLKGKEALEACDVVVYDHLVHPSILYHAPTLEKIYVGKKGGDPDSISQKSIEALLLKLARAGKRIVRLKGGDPFVFGRGGEEALWLTKHQIPFEVIPGVTAGIAAPAYAGIPVTHRGLASEVTLITAHEDPRKKDSDLNWKALAELQGTLVIYMGVKMLPKIIDELLRYGKKTDTPVSVIRWGTTADQQTVTGTLSDIVKKVEQANLKPPAVTVIGAVNRLRRELKWFEEKPLFGKTVLVTRSRKQASQLREALENQGAHVLEVPTIEIEPMTDFGPLDRIVEEIGLYDWIVFTSANGVEAFFNRLKTLKKDARILRDTKIAAIGPGTKAKLNSCSIEPDLMPEVFTTEGLIWALKKAGVSGKRFLLLRTNIAPDLLNRTLEEAGGKVTEISVYKTEKPKDLSAKVKEAVYRHAP
ncbi:MAG: uroporphyrinogen-III C-methyltransferase, partial [bacterium]|nr:uroporphyrinogen-III C-methyltransferase [bacterium]